MESRFGALSALKLLYHEENGAGFSTCRALHCSVSAGDSILRSQDSSQSISGKVNRDRINKTIRVGG